MAALQCFTASSAKPFPSTPKKPPFLGFSLPSSKPSLQLVRTNWTTHIRCQAKAATIPAEQQWMFDQTDFKGPVISLNSFLITDSSNCGLEIGILWNWPYKVKFFFILISEFKELQWEFGGVTFWGVNANTGNAFV